MAALSLCGYVSLLPKSMWPHTLPAFQDAFAAQDRRMQKQLTVRVADLALSSAWCVSGCWVTGAPQGDICF